MQAEELIRELPKGLLKWYKFLEGGCALYITGGTENDGPWKEALTDNGLKVDVENILHLEEISCRQRKSEILYDYIVIAEALERSRNPKKILEVLKYRLKPSGRLLLCMDNRLAVRYFCGERDPFTLRVYDGIDGYIHVGSKEKNRILGRNYSMSEIKEMLAASELTHYKFYSVFPGLNRPQVLLAENYMPNEVLDIRVFPQYDDPETVFLEEERLYDTLVKEGLLHTMADGYFIECSVNGELTEFDQITVSQDRGPENCLATLIKKGECVVKRPLYPEGQEKIRILLENMKYLKDHHVKVVDGEIRSGSYSMPYVEGQIATVYFQKLLKQDQTVFISELTRFFDIIQNSSEHVAYSKINWEHFDPEWEKRKADDPNIDQWKKAAFSDASGKEEIGLILRRGFIDMVSLNCFYSKGDFLFFDQEFYVENLPANVILIRTIDCIYRGQPALDDILPQDMVLKRFHLYKYRDTWRKYVGVFMKRLRKEKELSGYHKKHRRDMRIVNANRIRMNFSQEEYNRLFIDIFKNADRKKIFLFGSGAYLEKFLAQFENEFEIAGILDNNKEKWGIKLGTADIQSPDILRGTDEAYKVIICIKRYEEVLKQLKDMGVLDISIYDPDIEYAIPLKLETPEKKQEIKKYNIGYIAGVFDLFHIGHLNLLKRAKEQCNYLIVGVVTDEQVVQNKKTAPCIPFVERIEILRACKYVDKAVKIPIDKKTTADAFWKYRFDVQFSGSDYADDPEWLANRTYLRRHGSDLVFFPYTETTSSSKIKEVINTKLKKQE